MHEKVLIENLDKDNTFRFISKIFRDEIYVYFHDGSYRAISGFCPHFGGPLKFKENYLACHWHDWKFDAKSHKCMNHDINIVIRSYTIAVEGKILMIYHNDNN